MSNPLTTLYVGIDVSKNSNVVCCLSFEGNKLFSGSFKNNNDESQNLQSKIIEIQKNNSFDSIQIVLESTGVYSFHIGLFLSSSEMLNAANTTVFVVNPKMTKNYSKSYIDMTKSDPSDSFMLADFARCGRTKMLKPFRGKQRLALQRLTRYRKHLVDLLCQEKMYVLNNIFIKFSEFNNKSHDFKTFSDTFSTSAIEILTNYFSPEMIANTPVDKLADSLRKYSKNKFSDPEAIASKLQSAARASYRLDKIMYEPINACIASSFCLIRAYEKQIKDVEEQISTLIKGLDNQNEYNSLISIPGIGPVYASGILSEIGSISDFNSDDALANFAGLTWKKTQSGSFDASDTPMQKNGNSYLRYYLIEATQNIISNIPSYKEYFDKKKSEVTTHAYPRARVLTARKVLRLIYSLVSQNKLYQPK